eukprot:TRINITY_DN41639_c0_g1_i1.p1 TRINITY_DN41639_c0_g1~~TRINITY_DN41639_c0_g1_i1.p1  ORF type:complete len:504 (-),score=41.17 TRINITY_DN41639_c0_g1_i1:147-1658(-)
MRCFRQSSFLTCVLLSQINVILKCARVRQADDKDLMPQQVLVNAGLDDTIHTLKYMFFSFEWRKGRVRHNTHKRWISKKIHLNKRVLASLLAKQRQYRNEGVLVGVHSKSAQEMLFHILGSMGLSPINRNYTTQEIKDKVQKYYTNGNAAMSRSAYDYADRMRGRLARFASISLTSGSFSAFDTTPGADTFLDQYLERVMTFGEHLSIGHNASLTSQELEAREQQAIMRMVNDWIPEEALSRLTGHQQVGVRTAFMVYQLYLKNLKTRLQVSAEVPFLIKATDALTQGRAQYAWTDRFGEFAYVSSPNGLPMQFPDTVLGKSVSTEADAFKRWISLPGNSGRSAPSWLELSKSYLRKGARRPNDDAVFSQLQIPYRYIYPPPQRNIDPASSTSEAVQESESETMFEFEPVYDGVSRLQLDVDLCDHLERVLVPHTSPFCAHIRKLRAEMRVEERPGSCVTKETLSWLCKASRVKCESRTTQEECEDQSRFRASMCCRWHVDSK